MRTPAATPTSHPRTGDGHPRRWLILLLVVAAESMDLLDSTIVNVASPAIRDSLRASDAALEWIVGGYALAFSVGLITGGRLGDIYGRRRMFLIGAAGFALSSVACGLAGSAEILIASRLTQGAFAALLIPQGLGIVHDVFPADELGKAFGVFGPVAGFSAVIGPIAGGALVSGDLLGTGWRMVFFVTVPMAVLAFVGALRLLPESRVPVPPKLDLLGTALAAGAIGLLVYPLIEGRDLAWPAWTFALMAMSAATFAAFVLHSRRRQAAGNDPLITASVFRKRSYTSAVVVLLVFFSGLSGILLAFTLYLQLGRSFSPIHAGLTLVPWSSGTAFGAWLGGGLFGPRHARLVIQSGCVVMLGGVLWLVASIHSAAADLTSLSIVPQLLLVGAGLGALLSRLFGTALADVDDEDVGSASGVVNSTQQLGGAIGIAGLGTLFFSTVAGHGYLRAIELCLLAEAALLVVVLICTPLLPRSGGTDGQTVLPRSDTGDTKRAATSPTIA